MSSTSNQAAAKPAAPIGGNFKCPLHGIDTNDVNEWNNHCSDPKNNHTESGTTLCIGCNETLVYDNIPFHKIDKAGSKNIQLRCDECNESINESYKNKSIRKLKNPQAQTQQPNQNQEAATTTTWTERKPSQ